jgi:hypothetical protein
MPDDDNPADPENEDRGPEINPDGPGGPTNTDGDDPTIFDNDRPRDGDDTPEQRGGGDTTPNGPVSPDRDPRDVPGQDVPSNPSGGDTPAAPQPPVIPSAPEMPSTPGETPAQPRIDEVPAVVYSGGGSGRNGGSRVPAAPGHPVPSGVWNIPDYLTPGGPLVIPTRDHIHAVSTGDSGWGVWSPAMADASSGATAAPADAAPVHAGDGAAAAPAADSGETGGAHDVAPAHAGDAGHGEAGAVSALPSTGTGASVAAGWSAWFAALLGVAGLGFYGIRRRASGSR